MAEHDDHNVRRLLERCHRDLPRAMAMLVDQQPTAAEIEQMTVLTNLGKKAITLGRQSEEAWQEWAEAQMQAAENFTVVFEARALIAEAEKVIARSRAQLHEMDCKRIGLLDVATKALERAQAAEVEAKKVQDEFDGI